MCLALCNFCLATNSPYPKKNSTLPPLPRKACLPSQHGACAGEKLQLTDQGCLLQSIVDTDKAMPDALPALGPPEPTGDALPAQQPVFQPRQRKQGSSAMPASSASIRPSGPLALASDLAEDAEDRDLDLDQVCSA